MKMYRALLANALVIGAIVVSNACSGNTVGAPNGPSPTLTTSVASLALTVIGETVEVDATYSGGTWQSNCVAPTLNNLDVASFASTDYSPDGKTVRLRVRAEDYGTAAVEVSCRNTQPGSASVPVTVWPNGTWSGSVTWEGSCSGSDAAYKETATVAVDATGHGLLTAADTPTFSPRQYTITIPSRPAPQTFESSGTFTYAPPGGNAIPVPGHVTITLNKDKLHYAESTNWGVCGNIYIGDLTRGG